MKNAIRWMAQNHVAANLLMLMFVIGGLVMGSSLKQEVFPEVSLDMINVSVAYPGAGPEEIEEGILLKIEDNLTEIDGIKQLKSTAREGLGTVVAELRSGEDPDRILQEIKSAVDRIITIPEDAEEPVITKVLNRREVISVVIYGDAPERSLREQAETIRDELLLLPKITQVDLSGVRPYEISIEVDESTLRRYNLTLEKIAARVRAASVDLPAGSIKASEGEILLRTVERRYFEAGYENIIVLSQTDGSQVRLGDIATIKDTFAETDEHARFDDQPAAMIRVYRVSDQKPTEISTAVQRYISNKRPTLPTSLHISEWNDTSELLDSRMNLLIKNAWIGLILVFLVLGLFLEIRLALWVMLGIPISFLGAILMAPALGVSINMISLFAFIMALGIVVDDAIVVGENIYEHRSRHPNRQAAAIAGAQEVATPVIFSILTSICAFTPLLYISGNMGKFMGVIPVVVISVLIVSLVESMFVLPAHLALGVNSTTPEAKKNLIERIRLRFGRQLDRFINGPYQHWLIASLHHRYLTISISIAILLLCVGLVGGGKIKFLFMPEVDSDIITVTLQMPQGTPASETENILQRIVAAGRQTVQQIDNNHPEEASILRHIYALAGGTLAGGGPTGGSSSSAPHLGAIAMFLQPSEIRTITAPQISEQWRRQLGEIAGIDMLTFKSSLVHLGANIDVQLSHNDFNVLEAASGRLKQVLGEYPGVSDIEDNYAVGKKELKIRLRPEAETLGVTESELGRQIRAAYYGAEALRLQRGRNEIKVMVRYPQDQRYLANSLDQLRIRTPQGGELPLQRAAYIDEGRGFSEINRTDRRRVINVQAQVDSSKGNAKEILSDMEHSILAELQADYPGLSFDLEGEEKERKDSMVSMRGGFMLALFGIYALLAIPFRSYSQPLLIMAAIPFGVAGAILGHLIMGFDLTILSLFGVIALSGVVVNDSLLLIDKINQDRKKGMDQFQAIVDAGRRRFRPILLTSLTTFFGLGPMILETSVQAQFLIPMAISLAFGILFATGITLICIPSMYLILEDLRRLCGIAPRTFEHH
ncbi:MAG: efflux RND transporter permease subunit [Desulfuromonas sp.]|nr:efflux RND transporter permease subunit [Desulfuromonas sp.]